MSEGDIDLEDVKRGIRERVSKAVQDLEHLDLSDVLQAQVIAHLLVGRRTVAELVEEIYGQRKGNEGFMTSYSRVRRCVRQLESMGYVGTRIFGRDKPYRLTKYAVGRLADFDVPAGSATLIPGRDLALHGLTAVLAAVAIYFFLGEVPETGSLALSIFYGTFFVLVGASSTRLLETISRVM